MTNMFCLNEECLVTIIKRVLVLSTFLNLQGVWLYPIHACKLTRNLGLKLLYIVFCREMYATMKNTWDEVQYVTRHYIEPNAVQNAAKMCGF